MNLSRKPLFLLVLLLFVFLSQPATLQAAYTGDVAGAAGVNSPGVKDGGASWADFNNDGCLDLLVNTQAGGPSYLYQQNSAGGACLGTFADVTATAAPEIDDVQTERSAVWGDIDNDGDLDFAINSNSPIEIYVQAGGTFTKTFEFLDPGSPAPFNGNLNSEGLAWFDYDADGDLDLLVENNEFGIDILRNDLIGLGALGFTLVTGVAQANTTTLGLPNGGAVSGDFSAATDYDRDGDVDIIARKENGGAFGQDLYRNNGDGTFTAVLNLGSALNANKGGAMFCDFNNDLLFDAFWTDNGTNQIWLQGPVGTFTASGIPGFAGVTDNIDGVDCGDIDNDGDLDLILSGGTDAITTGRADFLLENQLIQTGTLSFQCVSGPGCARSDIGTGNGAEAAFVDYDRDGDLDLYINQTGNNELWQNDANNAGADNYVMVRPRVNIGAGRDALGATVTLATCDGATTYGVRDVSGGKGYGGQQSTPVHFGLENGPDEVYVVDVLFVGGTRVRRAVVPGDIAGYQQVTINSTDADDLSLCVPPVGVAKGASAVTGSGPYNVSYTFTIQNYGRVLASSLTLVEDLNTVFGAGNYTVNSTTLTTAPTDSNSSIVVNAAFNGVGDLLDGVNNDRLVPGDSAIITVALTLSAAIPIATYNNTVTLNGQGPAGDPVTDDSVNGTNPDADGSGNPNNDSSNTPVTISAAPLIGVAKGASAVSGSGPYTLSYTFTLQNYGGSVVDNLTLPEDLNAVYGAGNYTVTGLAVTTAPTIAGSSIVVNAAYAGTGDLLDPTNNDTLAVGDSTVLTLSLSLPASIPGGTYNNSVTLSGTGPGATPVTDTSTNGTNPDPDGSGDPNNDTSNTPVTIGSIPRIGVAKGASTVSGSGPYTVTYTFNMQNYGNVTISNLSLPEDLDAVFGAGNYTVTSLTASGTVTANGAYTGSAPNTDMLVPGSSSLAQGQTASLTLTLSLNAVLAGNNYDNSVTLSGTDPGGTPVTDTSTNGANPDPNGSGDPGDDTSITTITVPPAATPGLIGVAKASSTVLGTGPYTMFYTFTMGNYGGVNVDNLSLVEDLDAVFGAGNYTVTGIALSTAPANPGSSITVNAGFTGVGDLLDPVTNDALTPGDSAAITLNLQLAATLPDGNYTNSVSLSGTDPGGTPVTDISTSGTNPDPDGDGDPRNNTSTSISIVGTTPLIGVAKAGSIAGSGPYTATYAFTMRNYGNVVIDNLTLPEDLDAVFGAGNYTVTSLAVTTAPTDPGSSIVVNAGYAGTGDLLDGTNNDRLAVGDTAVITLVLQLPATIPAGNYTNFVTLTGTDPGGTPVTDISTSGTDPDPDGNNDPGDSTSITTITVGSVPLLGLAKSGQIAGSGPFTVTYAFTAQNYGTALAQNVAIGEDLDAVYGAGNYTINSLAVTTPPTDPTSSIVVNAGFTGVGDLLDAANADQLAAGDRVIITLVLQLPATLPAGVYNNSAGIAWESGGTLLTDMSVNGPNPDSNGNGTPTDDTSPTPLTIGAMADLSIAKSGRAVTMASPTVIAVGDVLTYTVTVTNAGPVDAAGVTVEDRLSSSVGFRAITGGSIPAASCTAPAVGASGTIQCSGITIAVGGAATLTYEVTVTSLPANGATFVNVAEIMASNQPDPDSTPANGVTTEDDYVRLETPRIFDPPFGLKTFNADGLPILRWTMVWYNPTPVDALNVVISDPVPAETTFAGNLVCVAFGGSAGTCAYDAATNTIRWTGNIVGTPFGGDLSLSRVEIAFDVNVPGGLESSTNVGTLMTPAFGGQTFTTDVSSTWDRGTPSTTPPGTGGLPGSPDITKTANPPFAQPGDEVTYTITLRNPSSETMGRVEAVDNVPDEMVILSTSATAGSINVAGQRVSLTVDSIPPQGSVSLTVRVRIKDNVAVPFILSNVATAGGRSATAQVISVQELPSTGETSAVHPLALLGIAAALNGFFLWVGFRMRQ